MKPVHSEPLTSTYNFMINRRRFLQAASASLALSALGADGLDVINQKPKRVGLIGTGWYGKSDLFRLIQVAPVEVVSLCDVDKHLLAEAAQLVSQRQKSRKTPRTYSDYQQMLKEKATKVKSFTLYVVGEGIEKKVDDFAAEVAAQVAAAKNG